jgi:hypothetical protein
MGSDRKYGRVTTEHGNIGDDEPLIVFRAQDMLVPAMLAHYVELCRAAGSSQRHLDLVEGTRQQFLDWQAGNPPRVPDSESSKAWMP